MQSTHTGLGFGHKHTTWFDWPFQVDVETFLTLTDGDLQELGIQSGQDRRQILQGIAEHTKVSCDYYSGVLVEILQGKDCIRILTNCLLACLDIPAHPHLNIGFFFLRVSKAAHYVGTCNVCLWDSSTHFTRVFLAFHF